MANAGQAAAQANSKSSGLRAPAIPAHLWIFLHRIGFPQKTRGIVRDPATNMICGLVANGYPGGTYAEQSPPLWTART